MDIQYYGANCLTFNYKTTRIVIDDNLASLGKKSIIKPTDVVLYTNEMLEPEKVEAKIMIDCPGEYEVADISIIGIAARAHMDEADKRLATIYKITTNDLSILICGHIYPQLSEEQLEAVGLIDVIVLPVGGNGYTLDAKGALSLIKEIEPKIVIPTHFADSDLKYPVPQASLSDILKELSMEPKEKTSKIRLRSSDLTDVTQLLVLERV